MSDKAFIRDQILQVSPEPWLGKAYRPVNLMIAESQAPKLYRAERNLHEAMDKCIKLWMEFAGLSFKENNKVVYPTYWTRGLPQVIRDLLDAHNPDGAEAGAVAFLESNGYKITRPEGR